MHVFVQVNVQLGTDSNTNKVFSCFCDVQAHKLHACAYMLVYILTHGIRINPVKREDTFLVISVLSNKFLFSCAVVMLYR